MPAGGGWDETTTSYRYRIRNPDEFVEDSFRTISFRSSGIKAVVGKLPGKDGMTLQSLIFPKDMFTEEEARQWVEDHPDTIKKYNPYHDRLGRFTTAGNASFFSIPKDKKLRSKLIERERQRMLETFDRPSLADEKENLKRALALDKKIWDENHKYVKSAPKEQQDALRYYMRKGCTEMNKYCRTGEGRAEIKKRVEALDKMANNHRSSEDMLLYRGVKDRLPASEADAKKYIGSIIQDKAFLSTTIKPATANSFAGKDGVILEIAAPKGTKGFYAETYWDSKKALAARKRGELGEAEWLMPRNTKIKITGIRKEIMRVGNDKRERIVYEAVVEGE